MRVAAPLAFALLLAAPVAQAAVPLSDLGYPGCEDVDVPDLVARGGRVGGGPALADYVERCRELRTGEGSSEGPEEAGPPAPQTRVALFLALLASAVLLAAFVILLRGRRRTARLRQTWRR